MRRCSSERIENLPQKRAAIAGASTSLWLPRRSVRLLEGSERERVPPYSAVFASSSSTFVCRQRQCRVPCGSLMVPRKADLLEVIAREPALAGKIRAAAKGEEVVFSNVVEHAQPTVCAALARALAKRVWIVCANLR